MPEISHDEYLATIGKLSHHAATADMYLFSAFYRLSKIDHATAKAIYSAFESINARGGLVYKIVDLQYDKEIKTLVTAIIDGAKKAQTQRNELAHTLIMFDGPSVDTPMYKVSLRKNKPDRITSASVQALMNLSREGKDQAKASFETLALKLGVPPELCFQ
jgi:hypothetical protein